MCRFFFNLLADDLKIPDLVGLELENDAEIRRCAQEHICDLWAQRVLAGREPLTGWLEVVDEDARSVLRLRL